MLSKTRSRIETEEYWENLIKKSVSRYFLLGLLAERPMHGYELGCQHRKLLRRVEQADFRHDLPDHQGNDRERSH